jgi:hypothetical protein
MTQETYRFAYDEANAELREILGQFEQLQARKDQIEQVVDALKSLLMEGPLPATGATSAMESAPFLVHHALGIAVEPKPVAAQESFPEPSLQPEPAYAGEQSSDPFQRRIDNALRHGLGSRESRILPRALSGLLSRA